MNPTLLASPILRLILAFVATLAVLPYAHGRSLIFAMSSYGYPEPLYAAMLLAGIVAIIGLTWRLYPQIEQKRWAKFILPLVFASWLLINGILIWVSTGDLTPKIHVLALFLPASLWVVWLSWMFFRPWSGPLRVGLLTVLVADLCTFMMVMEVTLAGEGKPDITWRSGTRHTIADINAEKPTTLKADAPNDYAQYLGPERLGVLPGAKLARDWEAHPPRELWRKEVGEGWGGFAVVGELAYTQERRYGEEDKGECVVCYRVQDGHRVWLHRDETGYLAGLGGPGPRATPTVVDGRVYAVGATGILNCLDALSGDKLWAVDIQKDNDAEPISHGVCASPLVLEEKVIVCPTGKNGLSLVAYHKQTGSRLWQSGQHQASYGSPLVAELAGVRQILLYTSEGVTGHDAATGKVLWSFPWTNGEKVNCSQPIPNAGGPDQVFISTGYGTGSALIKVKKDGDKWTTEVLWQDRREMKAKFTTPVLHDGYIYGLDDGILACLDVKTGKRQWKAGRYQHGQILLAGKLLLVQAEDGKVILVDPQPDRLHELGKIPALKGKTWNNPALAGRYLLVRNDKEAVCYELPVEK